MSGVSRFGEVHRAQGWAYSKAENLTAPGHFADFDVLVTAKEASWFNGAGEAWVSVHEEHGFDRLAVGWWTVAGANSPLLALANTSLGWFATAVGVLPSPIGRQLGHILRKLGIDSQQPSFRAIKLPWPSLLTSPAIRVLAREGGCELSRTSGGWQP